MTSSDHTTRLNTIVSIIGIVVGIIGVMPAEFSFPVWEVFFISITIFLFAISIKHLIERHPPVVIVEKTPITNFTAQLGNKNNPGFLPKEQRLTQIKPGQNPYVCGSSLQGNSAVFYGRGRELGGILGMLGNPDKPGNVSILGERRIGKSSLLNQIYQVLATVPNVVTIHTTMQDWSVDSQATFFSQLHQAISEALQIESDSIDDYAGFRDFIRERAEAGFRFVLMIDEFDKMTENSFFDAEFFSNMRALGERHEYQFAYLLSSYAPLADICHQGKIQESKFWNIFGTCYILGLLAKREAEQLIQEPMQRSLKNDFDQTQEIFTYTGYHPAFIQMVASEYWNAHHLGFAVNTDAIHQTLYEFYQDLWEQRSQKERELLRKIKLWNPNLQIWSPNL